MATNEQTLTNFCLYTTQMSNWHIVETTNASSDQGLDCLQIVLLFSPEISKLHGLTDLKIEVRIYPSIYSVGKFIQSKMG